MIAYMTYMIIFQNALTTSVQMSRENKSELNNK